MINYLLLRDNKQSGPYTCDELKAKGLKAYDLVWVEGKSAAWRYPCEIEELSAFAPMVEEQPFDRFYKKPSSNNTSVTPAAGRTSSPTVTATIVTGDSSSSVPGKRIIYVTLPAGRTAPRETAPTFIPAAPAVEIAVRATETAVPAPIAVAPLGEPEENTSRYNEDWKTAVEITPRNTRKHNSSRLRQILAIGLTVVALLAAGIFIGLSLNKDSLGFVNKLAPGKDKPAVTSSSASHPSQTLAVNTVPPVTPAQNTVANTASKDSTAATVTTPKTIVPSKAKSVAMVPKPQATTPDPKDSLLLAAPAVHREATHRSDITEEKVDKDVLKSNLSNLVSVGASGYTVGTFGGISDLQVTVSNHSIYALDVVVVEVQYIQSNKKVFKTENLYFRGIAPGSALMQEAPKSSRGIKVQYKITFVNSKELGLSYSAL
jgi:hypothetical protein